MRDDICTIPVSEVFEVDDGCPICRMIHTVEERVITYILGDAMMEPDIRISTNKKGFCPDHYEKMMAHRGRLQMALMLQTHLDDIKSGVFKKSFLGGNAKIGAKAGELNGSCFICDKMNFGIDNMIETIYRCYENEKEFRAMFDSQSQFCLPHFELLLGGISKKNCPQHGKEMADNLVRITSAHLETLCGDVSKYCAMHDYRNRTPDADWGDSKTAVERTVAFLSGKFYE